MNNLAKVSLSSFNRNTVDFIVNCFLSFRSHAYGMRRAESLREAANARDQRANDLAEQVRLLEHQLSLERISAERYIFTQLG